MEALEKGKEVIISDLASHLIFHDVSFCSLTKGIILKISKLRFCPNK